MIALWIALYLVVAIVVVLLSIQISKYVDLLDKKTTLSGGFIGGVFLAAVTSLPEVFTSISALFILPGAESSSMVIGNILGSNMFNSFVLAITFMFTFHHLKKEKIGKSHISTTATLVVFYILVAYATFAPDSWQFRIGGAVNIVSILLLVVYIISVKLMTEDSEDKIYKREEKESSLTLVQIISRFIVFAILLVVASIGITYLTDIVAEELNLGKTFAGAFFLGVATSLPEVSATISLCRLGNMDAAVGNIIGSNTFNFLILVIADIVSWTSPVYCFNTQSMLLIILGAISAFFMCGFICHKVLRKYKREEEMSKSIKAFYIICISIIAIAYVLFLILSNVL